MLRGFLKHIPTGAVPLRVISMTTLAACGFGSDGRSYAKASRMTAPKRILLTGAAGRIGRAFFKAQQPAFTFRLTDLAPRSFEVPEPHEFMPGDLQNPEFCQTLCRNIDVVVHLAGVPDPNATFEAVLTHNIVVTHQIFRAAKQAGCQRVVAASSAQAVEGYPVDVQVSAHMPVRPKNLYGVSKCFVEALASYYAFQEDLPAVVLRIGAYEVPEQHELHTTRDLSAFISPRDAAQLIERAIVTPEIRFFIAHGISHNRFKRLDLSETNRVLGYAPKDDAFSMFDIPIDTLAG